MLKVELLSRTSQALGVGFVGKQELLLFGEAFDVSLVGAFGVQASG